ASSRFCCRRRKRCRRVDNWVGATAEGRGSNGGRLVAGICAAKMPTFSDHLRASCRASVLLSNRFMGLPLLSCVEDRCSSFVTGKRLVAQGHSGSASNQNGDHSKRTW